MNKNKRYLSVFAVLFVVLVILATSCVTVYEKKPSDSKSNVPTTPPAPASGAPVIKSFTADPASIDAGQTSRLNWEVSGATQVEITPVVGTVDAVSTVLVSPPTTTTYTLTATNEAGTITASVTVNLTSSAAVRPDLVITDISVVSKLVYYKVKNIGGTAAKGCRAYLYVNGGKEAEDYIEALDPGQERTDSFSNYTWVYETHGLAGQLSTGAPKQFTVEVCADVENTVVEYDEGNNCKAVILGEKFNYRFVDFYHLATWATGYGILKLPLPEESANGAALVTQATLEDEQGYGSVLLTIPQQVPDGWIEGGFGDFYVDDLRISRVRDVVLADMAKFSAKVGFTRDTAPNSQARFIFGIIEQSGFVHYFPAITVANDGKLDLYEVDLSQMAGKKVRFVLRVEVIGSAEKVKPAWVDPRVLQP